MTLDEMLLQRIREGSGDVWRGLRRRVGIRLILFLLLTHACFYGALWLLSGVWHVGHYRDAALAMGRVLVPLAALFVAGAMALLDSLYALIVSGAFLRSLGDLMLSSQHGWARPVLADQFAAFASPHGLARVARLRDLPLILFLARSILRIDVKPLLQAAETGLGREALVREVERQAKDRSAVALRRLKAVVWCLLGFALMLPFLVGGVLR
jgi:hypothetical protein